MQRRRHRARALIARALLQQFVSTLCCQLGRAHSLSAIEQGLRSCEGRLSHLGIEVLARSSLSYVNEHRPWQLYRNLFHGLYGRLQSQLALAGGRGRKKFGFKNKPVSLDSSVIEKWGWSMSNLVALLRTNLFTHRDLRAWLDNPFAVPPDTPAPEQVSMAI